MYNFVKVTILHLLILIDFSTCRDFYLGMFKKNDLLMSQDTLYKERLPFRYTYAKYGRTYNCPITYVRVLDRLNIGRGPRVEIIRGGLRKKYIVLRLTSPYNNPISVNIFVGCENNKYSRPPWNIIRPNTKTTSDRKTQIIEEYADEEYIIVTNGTTHKDTETNTEPITLLPNENHNETMEITTEEPTTPTEDTTSTITESTLSTNTDTTTESTTAETTTE